MLIEKHPALDNDNWTCHTNERWTQFSQSIGISIHIITVEKT